MERLTRRFEDGEIYSDEFGAVRKCKVTYENGEDKSVYEGKLVDKLAEYEDLEESGRLVKLPCVVGDTVYVLMQYGGIAEAEVRDYIHFLTHGFCLVLTSDKFDKENIPFSEIGKTVFLTREAAEAKLKELKSENDI